MSDRGLHNRGDGRFRDALRRMFGEGDNPLNWSLPLYKAWGIEVRIHFVFLLYIVAELLVSVSRDRLGFLFTLEAMASLFGLVLLHEYGHCFACRRVGGEADRILLWPLGGLAYCAPPDGWKPNLITVLGGPAVNALLFPVFAGALWILCGPQAAFFNPFKMDVAWLAVSFRDGTTSYWLYWLWGLHITNAALFLFNMLVPMFPMDCGRTLQCLLWRSKGYRRATEITIVVGYATAAVLAVFSIVGNGQSKLLGLAIFGGISCWFEKRMLAMRYDIEEFPAGYATRPVEDPERESRAAARRRKQEEADRAELDRILDKIRDQGMAALTGREKRFLKRTTETKRTG